MSSKRFKYQNFLDKYKNCPPSSYKEVEMTAFRWVFEECDEESFKPVLILQPSRKLGNEDLQCTGYALSMFKDKGKALQRYQNLFDVISGFKTKVGGYIAELNLSTEDGEGSLPDLKNFTHFDFHEYSDSEISKKVINIVEIFDGNGNING